MKIAYEDLSGKLASHSLVCYEFAAAGFDFNMHYHPEYELTYIAQGAGMRFVGSHAEGFAAGDLVLVNSAVPHSWCGSETDSSAVVVQFSKEWLAPFLAMKEFGRISRMLHNLPGALVFDPARLAPALAQLPRQQDAARIASFWHLLHLLSLTPARAVGTAAHQPFSAHHQERMATVCRYIQAHYRHTISVAEVARTIHLSPGAFCKFFKQHTSMTFTTYLNTLRIEAICQQLMRGEPAHLGTLVMQYGFESQQYFNRVFKELTGLTPSEYIKRYQ